MLAATGMDSFISKIPVADNPILKANCSRALKNLASDAIEALEEGTIMSLIAMSLEGKATQLKEEVAPTEIIPQNYKANGQPRCILENGECSSYTAWKIEYAPTLGGSAGKGPNTPDPPIFDSEENGSSKNVDFASDLIDANETEGKSKMAFAKMQVPEDLRESYKLVDEDFKREEEKLEKAAQAAEDGISNEAPSQVALVENEKDSSADYIALPVDPIPEGASPLDTVASPSGSSRKSLRKSLRQNNSPQDSSPKQQSSVAKSLISNVQQAAAANTKKMNNQGLYA